MGGIVRGQMRFWLEFYDVVLNCNGTHPADGGRYFMPVNAYNEPNAASGDTGGGIYAFGGTVIGAACVPAGNVYDNTPNNCDP